MYAFGGVVSVAYKNILKRLIVFPDQKEFPRWNP